MKLKNELQSMQNKKRAILAVEFWNFESLKGILLAASRADQPIILRITRSTISYLGLQTLVAMSKSMFEQHGVTGWLHLDRANSVFLIRDCLEAGIDSVTFMQSDFPLPEYQKQLREIVKLAKKSGGIVEAAPEGIFSNEEHSSQGIDLRWIGKFVKDTGIDALQVMSGGLYDREPGSPDLLIKRINEIKNETDAFLVLPEVKEIPDLVLSKAIRSGVCKVNLGDELEKVFISAARKQFTTTVDDDPRILFLSAIEAVRTLVTNRLNIVSS